MPKTSSSSDPDFVRIGRKTTQIAVQISYKIIQLFSEGLYRSPTKAIEELVTNAFDAGASRVQVDISPDLASEDSTIVIMDDGTGMDRKGLSNHWLIGVSHKRDKGVTPPKGRKQIGRFGIGKLATYVLANRLTHITKVGPKYYSTSMDYKRIPSGQGGGIAAKRPVKLDLRELTEEQAEQATSPWTTVDGKTAFPLFGKGSPQNWTVAVLSELKDMASQLTLGRLHWVLATSMPIRDDFKLFLNDKPVEPQKQKGKRIRTWIIGKDMTSAPKSPSAKDLVVTVDRTVAESSPSRFGLTHPQLGRITGKVELFADPLTGGKSEIIGRSHGFFVYVRERLINVDDEYFGIDSNRLRHGTFSRFRCEVNIDRLDEELRSSRESVRQTSLLTTAQNILEGIFNVARSAHETYEESVKPGILAANRVAATPYSLTGKPLFSLVNRWAVGKATPKYIAFPEKLTNPEKQALVNKVEADSKTDEGLIRHFEITPLTQSAGIARFDVQSGTLQINALHPFVAYFLDEFEDKQRSLPLELVAASEVLLEAALYERDLLEEAVQDIMAQRDELFRYLAKSRGKRNALLISQALLEAATDRDALQTELVAAFDSMGFDAIPIGGPGKPDGLAEFALSGTTRDGQRKAYKVSLEAKSKETAGKKVTAKAVGVSAIARQRNDYECEHAIVVGPDFPTTEGEKSALYKEIKDDREKAGKTITLVRIIDMAKLVRLVPAKRISLDRIREMLWNCTTPEESAAWIDRIAQEKISKPPYKEILEAIESEQRSKQEETIKYANVQTYLRVKNNLTMTESEIVDLCKSLSNMAPHYISVRKGSVEIQTKPAKILEAIRATIHNYPENEQATINH